MACEKRAPHGRAFLLFSVRFWPRLLTSEPRAFGDQRLAWRWRSPICPLC